MRRAANAWYRVRSARAPAAPMVPAFSQPRNASPRSRAPAATTSRSYPTSHERDWSATPTHAPPISRMVGPGRNAPHTETPSSTSTPASTASSSAGFARTTRSSMTPRSRTAALIRWPK